MGGFKQKKSYVWAVGGGGLVWIFSDFHNLVVHMLNQDPQYIYYMSSSVLVKLFLVVI